MNPAGNGQQRTGRRRRELPRKTDERLRRKLVHLHDVRSRYGERDRTLHGREFSRRLPLGYSGVQELDALGLWDAWLDQCPVHVEHEDRI